MFYLIVTVVVALTLAGLYSVWHDWKKEDREYPIFRQTVWALIEKDKGACLPSWLITELSRFDSPYSREVFYRRLAKACEEYFHEHPYYLTPPSGATLRDAGSRLSEPPPAEGQSPPASGTAEVAAAPPQHENPALSEFSEERQNEEAFD